MWWNKYVGLKYGPKGRSKDAVDCWGLVHLVYKNEVGIDLPDYLECYNSPDDKELISEVVARESLSKWEEVETPKEFDVIVMRIDGFPFHVGIYAHDGLMIHCERGFNTVLAKMDSFHWKNRIAGIYRWKI